MVAPAEQSSSASNSRSAPAPAPAPAVLAATDAQPAPHGASHAMPVTLNEAALDSPTFRAVTVHFADQADALERWLDSYVRSTSKLVHDLLALEDTINTYIARVTLPASPALMPASLQQHAASIAYALAGPPAGAVQAPTASSAIPAIVAAAAAAATASTTFDAVIDTDHTARALRHCGDGAREWWAGVLGVVRRLEPSAAEPIRSFLAKDLRAFKDARRQLEASQKTFDAALARYVSQSKTKEPSALREDAFAAYETRRAYIKASMDFCELAPQMRCSLDGLLVRVCADMMRDMRRGGPGLSGSFMRRADEMERIRGWSKEMESAEPIFRRELQLARRDIGEATLSAWRPSRELDDYSLSTVPFLSSKGGPLSVRKRTRDNGVEPRAEKQGWLFLRTQAGKPVRTTWIRRWHYCVDGVFGWLVPGPQGVLQGDEIGVLLCSAKPAIQEERRFCFEVKTKTQTLLLQSETQNELIEWIEVFELAKEKAFETSADRSQGGVDPAFSITPPSIPEFSARALEGQDGDPGGGAEFVRSNTERITVPPGDLASRASLDVTGGGPRRAITTIGREAISTLSREEGETSRDHAARILQRLDPHRKSTVAGSEGGGLASLVMSSHAMLSGYAAASSPGNLQGGSTTAARGLLPGMMPAPISPYDWTNSPSLAPLTLARPPVATALSKHAILASASGADPQSSMPTAVIANYWGSSPWAYTYLSPTQQGSLTPVPDVDDPFIATVQETGEKVKLASSTRGQHKKTLSADGKVTDARALEHQLRAESFPAGYPLELRVQHAQFRLLFPRVPLDEKLVLVFNAAWSSSSGEGKEDQSAMAGSGRIHVTPDNMYFYGHQMGLVVAYFISLDVVAEVTAAPGRDCDFIFIHLTQDSVNHTGFSRITIKIFLEDLSLVQSRLNFLVDDLQAEEPMDLPELVSALANLEKDEYDRPSPSAESWEEVASNTPIDDGTASGRPVHKRTQELATGSFTRSLSARGGRQHSVHQKVHLPTYPVVYEPENMGKPVAERHFEISAKACFHVLFGDKSFVFPKLYFERRAKEMTQGPWELQDHGLMRRQFRFKVDHAADMLGRAKPAMEVTDEQAIDIFQDHVTYVVTHLKTAWHLPQSDAFKNVTKVVITHVAKSKCKLAIYACIDWGARAAFGRTMLAFTQGVVQRQALHDAVQDAEELAEVATDQVRKLGPHSRTKRAIQVYGGIGQQKQVVVFSPTPITGGGGGGGSGESPTSMTSALANGLKTPVIRPRSLTAMMLETGRSVGESAITSVLMWAWACVREVCSVVRAHRVILALLGASTLYNALVVTQGSSAWWAERKAAAYMDRIGVGPNTVMSRAIYLADLEEASKGTGLGGTVLGRPIGSACYETFQSIVNTTDIDGPWDEAGAALSQAYSRATARRLRRARQRLGTYRHDLLVAMRVVNGIEAEMVQSEWENWLTDETGRCERAGLMLRYSDSSSSPKRQQGMKSGDTWGGAEGKEWKWR